MAAQVRDLKWVRGTKFIVDGFNFQDPECRTYFLTHCHSDHTTGLRRDFAAGEIVCTPISAALLIRDMRIPAARVRPVPLDEKHNLDGVDFTFMDANHCPGAAMILFEVPLKDGSGRKQAILHTGDMRWQHSMADHPALRGVQVDLLYMDTTYAAPKHLHPPQDIAIAKMVELMRQHVEQEPATLFVVGSYHIGKERAYIGPARALGWRIYCPPAKLRVLKLLELTEADMAVFTSSPVEARIHVGFMGKDLLPEALIEKIRDGHWTHVVAFRPTGWTYRRSGKLETRKEGVATVYGIPYSEHSNYAELRDCVASLRPKRLIPTVNVTEDPASSRRLVDRFAQCMDLSTDRSRLDCYFRNSRLAKPAGALSAPPDLQLIPDCADDAEGSDLDDAGGDANARSQRSAAVPSARDVADETPVLDKMAHRQQSGCGSTDEVVSDADDGDANLAAADTDRERSGDIAASRGGSREHHGESAACAEPSSSMRGSGCRTAASSKTPACTAGVSAADPATPAAHAAPSQRSTAEVKREADDDAVLADIDLREQAALMALFEDRRRSSHTKRLLAAATNSVASAGVAPPLSQEKIGCGTCQEQRHRLGRSISAPAAAAEVDSDSAVKRQRTLRNYFQVLLQSMRCR